MLIEPTLGRLRWSGRNIEVKTLNEKGGRSYRTTGIEPLSGVVYARAMNGGQETSEPVTGPRAVIGQ